MSAILSKDQLNHYQEHGYIHVKNAIPDDVLTTIQNIIEPWAEGLIQSWISEGLLSEADQGTDLDFNHRLLHAWRAAGKPVFRRSPFRNLIQEKTYHLFRHPTLLTLAEDILRTSELNVHGIFNQRVGLPEASFTETPWHQDCGDWDLWDEPIPDGDRSTSIVSMWIPLQRVHKTNGCLQFVSLEETGRDVFPLYDYNKEETGFTGMSPEDIKGLQPKPMEMDRSDVLMFTERTAHSSVKNTSEQIRWSIDLRYEATATATVIGSKYGFVAQSRLNPGSETSCEDWLKQRQI